MRRIAQVFGGFGAAVIYSYSKRNQRRSLSGVPARRDYLGIEHIQQTSGGRGVACDRDGSQRQAGLSLRRGRACRADRMQQGEE
jgi:hypothetical protein